MRRFAANYIFLINKPPIKNGIVETDNKGKIIQIIDTGGDLRESGNLEFYNGIIVPGFINTHCHLELSELKGKFQTKTGLPQFLANTLNYKKNSATSNTFQAIEKNDELMYRNGIVAVGDISNTNHTLSVKLKSKIYYHTFIELIGLGLNANEIFEKNKMLYNEYVDNSLASSIVPHAPYSVSFELFKLIKEFAEKRKSILSIHNQETVSEDEMYIKSTGLLKETLISLGINKDRIPSTGQRSLKSISEYLPKSNNILFVHNLFSSIDDINRAAKKFQNAYWSLCPLSNMYIENKLPDLNIFKHYFDKITLGTDSLASNTTLSILSEMKILVKEFPFITFDQIIQWATINGARALNIEKQFGSIRVGKTPGLNLITHFDFCKMQISERSEVKVLI